MNATRIMSGRRFLHTTRTMLAEKTISPSFNLQSTAEKFNLSPAVFTQALTHKSYKHGTVPHNERLQYLGRRSLEFFAMESNKEKSLEELEKYASKVFDADFLARKFDALGIEGGVQSHVSADNVTRKIKATTVKALAGAIYHERGINEAREFVNKYVLN